MQNPVFTHPVVLRGRYRKVLGGEKEYYLIPGGLKSLDTS